MKLMFGLLVLLIMVPMTYAASPVFFEGFALYPSHGTSQTNILAMVRPDKPASGPLWLYIFWDDMPIITRLMDPIVDKTHTYMWDIIIHPPQDPFYCKKGTHQITCRVEDEDGNVKYGVYVFKIDDTIPVASWFDDLPQEFIDQITGPAGPKGNTGATGPEGDRGSRGLTGSQGPIGPQGEAGEVGIAGEDGSDGLQGPKGDAGPLGPQGIAGETGPLGATGDAGSQGVAGEAGPQGPKGETGDTGAVGPKGAEGEPAPASVAYGGAALGGVSLLGLLYMFFRAKP